MQLWSARIAEGRVTARTMIAPSVCECCQTDLAVAAGGPVVAFRGRSREEIRDISVARSDGEQWRAPQPVHDDGWEIPGCPVNGPAMATQGGADLAVAWFTAANGEAKVQAAFSSDGGSGFAPPVLLDADKPLGRLSSAWADGAAHVTWLAPSATGAGAEIRLQRVLPSGVEEPAQVVALTTPSRKSGVPQIVHDGDRLLIAWIDAVPGKPTELRLSVVPLG